jgi:hypothetical protein
MGEGVFVYGARKEAVVTDDDCGTATDTRTERDVALPASTKDKE